jgi:hypothetical protein
VTAVNFPAFDRGNTPGHTTTGALIEKPKLGLEIPVRYADFDDFWDSNTVPVGPQGKVIAGMSPDAREQLRVRLREHLPATSDGPIVYESFANAVKGRVLG